MDGVLHVSQNLFFSCQGDLGCSTAGGVFRDESGIWMQGFVFRIGIASALIAELWGIFQGNNICWNIGGCKRVEMGTDCLEAVTKIRRLSTLGEPQHPLFGPCHC